MFHLICIVTFITFLLPSYGQSGHLVPNIRLALKDDFQWLSIESTQVTEYLDHEDENVSYKVIDLLDMDNSISYSKYQREKDGFTFELISSRGKTFYIANNICHLDERHDFSTIYPWRYQPIFPLEYRLPGSSLLGLGAVWMNAMAKKTLCDLEQEESPVMLTKCHFVDDLGMFTVDMYFKTQSGVIDWKLDSIQINHKLVVHHQDSRWTSAIKWSASVIDIKSIKKEDVVDVSRKLESCDSDYFGFPSLTREMVSAADNYYNFAYILRGSDLSDQKLFIEEFSYEKKMQIITIDDVKTAKRQRYLRLLGSKSVDGQPASFLIKKDIDQNVCLFEQLTESCIIDLESMTRNLYFRERLEDSRTTQTVGTLLGLGALLMNIADAGPKRVDLNEYPSLKRIEGAIVWETNEIYSGSIWTHVVLNFAKEPNEHRIRIKDLYSVDLYRITYGLNKEREYTLILSFKILDFQSKTPISGYIEDTFKLSPTCPKIELVDSLLDENKSSTMAYDEGIEFPSLYDYLDLARDYSMESDWTFSDGTLTKLKEYLIVDGQVRDSVQGSHFARLDITKYSSVSTKKKLDEFTIYLSYLKGSMIKTTQDQCKKVKELDKWITSLAGDVDFGADESSDSVATKHLGIGGLWAKASKSNSIEFIEATTVSPSSDHLLWRMDKDIEGISVTFKFSRLIKREAGHGTKFKLISIDIEETVAGTLGGIESIHIVPREISVGAVSYVSFLLPPSCDPSLDNFYQIKAPKFPTFDQSIGESSSTMFEFVYDMSIDSNGLSATMEISEANNINEHGDGLIQVKLQGYQFYIWISSQNGITELEDSSSNRCKRVSDALKFFRLDGPLKNMFGGSNSKYSNLIVSNIWSGSNSGDGFNPSVNYKILQSGKTIRYINYEKHDSQSGMTITFKHTEDKLLIHSINLMDFKTNTDLRISMKSVRGEDNQSRKVKKSSICSDPPPTFPRLSANFAIGDLLVVRSEVVADLANGNNLSRFMLNEHLLIGRKFRTTSRSKDKTNDYLLLEGSKNEAFDISEEYHCSQMIEGVGLFANNYWMQNILFESADTINMYGPLNLWSIAENEDMTLEYTRLDTINCFVSSNQLNSWLNTHRWLVESHKRGAEFKYALEFDRDTEENKFQLQSLEVLKDTDGKYKRIVYNLNLFEHLTSLHLISNRDFASERLEKLNIPLGYGCIRKENPLENTKDIVVFNSVVAAEFEYVANLWLEKNGVLLHQPVVLTGSFGRCPDLWVNAPMCALDVDIQRKNYMDGVVESEKRLSCKVGIDSDLFQTRLYDYSKGTCEIHLETRKRSQLFTLRFSTFDGNTISIDVTEEMIAFAPSELDQVIRFDNKPYGTLVTYEKRLAKFTLNDYLSGETSISRNFVRLNKDEIYGGYSYHNSFDLEINVIGKAKLTLAVSNRRTIECVNVLQRANPEDCYESTISRHLSQTNLQSRRVRQFVIHFEPIGDAIIDMTQLEIRMKQIEERILDEFVKIGRKQKAIRFGRIRLTIHKDRSNFQAAVKIMPPAQPVDSYLRLDGYSLSDKPSLITLEMTDSKYSCSNLCESITDGKCFAFSYCANRECQISRTELWDVRPSEDLVHKLKTKVKEDSACTVFYAPDGKIPMPMDETIEKLRDEILRESFKVSYMTFPGMNIVRFVAVKLEEVSKIHLIDEGSNPADELLSQYFLISSNGCFGATSLKGSPGLKVQVAYAATYRDCIDRCTHETCDLLSYCTQDRSCTTIGHLKSWSDRQRILSSIESKDHCSVYSRDYRSDFHLFTNTNRPNEFIESIEETTSLDCAARCRLSEGDKSEANDCLSFDFCTNGPNRNDQNYLGTCYLKKMHIIMDDFENSILHSQQVDKSQSDRCAHYSKSLVADYRKLPQRRIRNHSSIVYKGTFINHCALLCHRNDLCQAFELCRLSSEMTTCYLDQIDGNFNRTEKQSVGGILFDESDNCDVYEKSHSLDGSDLYWPDSLNEIVTPGKSSSVSLVFCYLASALALGIVLSIIYTLVTGKIVRPLERIVMLY